jgi:hypothetical protein
MRYTAIVSIDIVHCELCGNPYRLAAGACDLCGQSGPVEWEKLAQEARSLRVQIIAIFGLALLGLVATFWMTRGAMLLFVLPLSFGGFQLHRLLAIQRQLKQRGTPRSF